MIVHERDKMGVRECYQGRMSTNDRQLERGGGCSPQGVWAGLTNLCEVHKGRKSGDRERTSETACRAGEMRTRKQKGF